MQLYFIENIMVLMVIIIALSGVLGVAAFAADHWDSSGKTFTTWLLTGFPSPWRYARRFYCQYSFNKLSYGEKWALMQSGVDPKTLTEKGDL